MADIPFFQAAREAADLIEKGAIVYQKFTCDKCGARQMMEEKNSFFKAGRCEECGSVTDLRLKGCGYAVILLAGNRARAS